MEVGGIEPPTPYVVQELTGQCDEIVTLFLSPETANVYWPSPRNLGGANRRQPATYTNALTLSSLELSPSGLSF